MVDIKDFSGWVSAWKSEIKRHYKSILFSIFLLILAAVINYNAGVYVTEKPSTPVSDFILDHLGPYNLNIIFVYLWLLIAALLVLYSLIFAVGIFHRVLGQFSFLIIIRSFFITLTHLKTPLSAIPPAFPAGVQLFVFENDLFFSGHTAIPFLGFLIYKGHKIRWLFLAASIVMAITVLAMHRHYSIDVFSAYFITYGCYKIAQFFSPFKKSNK